MLPILCPFEGPDLFLQKMRSGRTCKNARRYQAELPTKVAFIPQHLLM